MDKDHKIWECGESAFLDFLYAERDREYAMSSVWGINYWVVGATILGLLGYAYSQISVDYELFSWRLLTYYSVVLGAIVIALAAMVGSFIHEDRWKNSSRVTNVWTNFPFYEVFGKGVIAYASGCGLRIINDYGLVMWLFMSLFVLEVGVLVYSGINCKQLILVEKRGCVFSDKKLEIAYRVVEVLICILIVIIALFTWGNKYEMGVKEFEMACVLIITIGILWMMRSRIKGESYRYIDKIIDEYVYGTMTKKEAYTYLYIESQGYDIFDILHSQYKMAKSYGEYLKEHHHMHEQYLQMIEEGKLVYENFKKYMRDVNRDACLAKKALDMANDMQKTLNDVISMKATSSVCVNMVKTKMSEMAKLQKDLIQYVDENREIQKSLIEYINLYNCRKTKRLCDKMDCERRNDRFSVTYWIRGNLKKICGKNK